MLSHSVVRYWRKKQRRVTFRSFQASGTTNITPAFLRKGTVVGSQDGLPEPQICERQDERLNAKQVGVRVTSFFTRVLLVAPKRSKAARICPTLSSISMHKEVSNPETLTEMPTDPLAVG